MAVQTMEGTLTKVHLANSTPKWLTYDIAFSDGEDQRVLLPADSNMKLEDYTGKKVGLFKKNDNWFVSYKELLNGATGGSQQQSYSGPKKDAKKSDEYWEEKDVRISILSLFTQCTNLYAASIATFETKPRTPADVDELLNEAFSKAQEFSIRMYAKKDADDN